MKKIFTIALFLLASVTHAESLDWADLEQNQPYVLNQSINFPQGYEFKSGSQVEIIDVISGGIPVVYFQVHVEECQIPEASAEMIILNPTPEDTTANRSIAVALTEDCNLNVWVELKDLYSKSILDVVNQLK